MLYSGGKSAGGVCLFFGADGGVLLEFFFFFIGMAWWYFGEARTFAFSKGGILLCVLTAAATGRRC